MLLNTARSGDVIQGGIAETTNFRIEVDGKMFKLLSDTLYQNKIGSMIREVSCNAVDAHIAADKADIPFTIHAPNHLEPWFSVIDEGVGLSHDEVINIFTCFGKSTKTNSNTQVGAFGFGSKTPFAYTNTFTVISTKDGKRNCYSAVIGEDGTPAMNLMDSSDTENGNGVEITVAVENYDMREFHNEIREQLRYFKVKPIIKGANIEFSDPLASIVEKLDDNTYFRQNGNTEVVQGGVAYPLDTAQICKNLSKDSDLRKFIDSAMYRFSPVFFFDIGQIAVTPSRESISYDAPTIKNILDRIETVRNALLARINEKMNAANTIWEKTQTLRDNAQFYSSVMDFNKNPWGVYGGTDPHIYIKPEILNQYETGNSRQRHYITRYNLKGGTNTLRMDSMDGVDRLYPSDNVIIVIDDGAGSHVARIRNHVFENDSRVYFFHSMERKIVGKYTNKDGAGNDVERIAYADNITATAIDPVYFQKFTEAVDGAKIVFLFDLPKPERVYIRKENDGTEVKERVKYTPAKAYLFRGFCGWDITSLRNFDKTFEAPKKMEDEAAYVVLKDRKVEFGISEFQRSLLGDTLKSKEFTLPIYAIREKDLTKIANNPNWKPLGSVLEALEKTLRDKYKTVYVRAAMANRSQGISMYLTDYLPQHLDLLEDGELRKLMRRQRPKSVRDTGYNDVCRLLYGNKMQEISNKIVLKNQALSEKLRDRYTFLYNFRSYVSFDEKYTSVMINLVNELYKKSLA